MVGSHIKRIVLFLTGFCVYITIEVLFRGHSYPVMGICGGVLLIFLDLINDKISWDLDILVQGSIGSCMVTSIELIIGEIWKLNGWEPMWDYSNIFLNFDGVICLPFSLAWMGLSIFGILIADAINFYMFCEEPIPYYKLFGKVVIKFKEKYCRSKDKMNK